MTQGVEFEQDTFSQMTRNAVRRNSGIYGSSSKFSAWLIARGIAKDDATAQWIQLGIVAVNIVITIFVIKYLI